jgi:uncharacterized membrane protein YeaQ/YmgE (transglycosylase-associated protein family)
MEANDFWTFVGLVTGAFVGVVAPKISEPGHTANTVTYLVGAAVVLIVAGITRARTRRLDRGISPGSKPPGGAR